MSTAKLPADNNQVCEDSCPRFGITPKWMILASVLIAATVCQLAVASEQTLVHLNMPDVRPIHDESYLCTAHRLSPTKDGFIVGFQPNASASKVHHILIYGCAFPGKSLRDSPKLVWECGEMNMGNNDPSAKESTYDHGPVCAPGGRSTILFGWALDAPAIELPPKVGFKIGGNSGLYYLVLQVHYGDTSIFKRNPEITDDSGINLEVVSGPNSGITKSAGIYLLLSYGYVRMGTSKHSMECMIQEDKVIHPFRFRTHTHKLGTRVAAYRKPADDPTREILIGEHSPQEPQMFYPVADSGMTIRQGDRIYAYCDYNNTRDHIVYIGATGNDEMCNYYMMYWTDGELLNSHECMAYNS